ncbi:tRNA 2-selenouridine(34) synthase MnmH [Zooshikella harenae]|uniref:tRNA 2-selenouridine(34) synthase MnmH n=1 Tax=Zooshikella harenae TaxID=2827238 RepID=A0ABS5Z7X5_9GAMM|nr:tRNA 2-selenouridine(34) synthase MnmH [Zooshikella harenae]MBU2710147.1 tRNA 2-selenouridine(34) synthase MnmH [Zooshikella harenae]
MFLLDEAQWRTLLLNDTPLLDVRAPIEFRKGSFPSSVNLPLLNNEQRKLVGTCYKEKGQNAAITLGFQLATPEIKQTRINSWLQFIRQNPHGALYCARGGLRSTITQQWLVESGIDYPRVVGGYKTLRSYLLTYLEREDNYPSFIILSGLSCVGKTLFLRQFSAHLDLEGIAKHRGSAFGTLNVEQPSQASFENALAVKLMQLKEKYRCPILLEDESHLIGRCALPKTLQRVMWQSSYIELTASIEERIENAFQDYIENSPYPLELVAQHLMSALTKIKRRLAGERYSTLTQMVQEGMAKYRSMNDGSLLRCVIKMMLIEYYDPMYYYHQQKYKTQPLFKGNAQEVSDWVVEKVQKESKTLTC